jgi:glutamine synthetase
VRTQEPIRIRNHAEARQLVESRDIPYIKVAVTDIDGILRGKYLSRAKFLAGLEKGFGFCDVIVGWDSNDQLYDNVKYTGWHTAYPDAPVRVVPETARLIPFEDDLPFFLCELAPPAETICPRGTLRRVLQRAEAMGFGVLSAFEYEFFLFEETPHSVREKGYRNLKSITPGHFGYSVLRSITSFSTPARRWIWRSKVSTPKPAPE